jgi:hypothetical protein
VVLATDLCAVLVQSPNHFAKNGCNLTAVFNEEKGPVEKNNIIVSAKTLNCVSMAQGMHQYGAFVMLLTRMMGKIKIGALKTRRAANFAAPKTWWRPSNHYP